MIVDIKFMKLYQENTQLVEGLDCVNLFNMRSCMRVELKNYCRHP